MSEQYPGRIDPDVPDDTGEFETWRAASMRVDEAEAAERAIANREVNLNGWPFNKSKD